MDEAEDKPTAAQDTKPETENAGSPTASDLTLSTPPHAPNDRATSAPTPTDDIKECRVCLQTDDASEMVSPCSCAGSLGSVHLKCLKSWVRERASLECEICKSKYIESLLPVLEPEAEAGAAQRTARRDTAAAAIAAAAARHAAAQQDRGPVWKTRKFWMYLFFITAVLGAVVCLLLLLGMRAGEELWAAIVLRVVAFGLPLFIIFRAMFACWQLRQIERQQLQSGDQAV